MNADRLFSRAVAALPKIVRDRLDSDTPLDWSLLEDPETAAKLGEAARSQTRLPDSVETLVNRLIDDVGIAAADLKDGIERQGAAGAWTRDVAIEAEGESYRLRSRGNGAIHTGVRPEAVAGYATLALELASSVHETAGRWMEAGERHRTAANGEESLLALCAIHICEGLKPQFETAPSLRTTAALAGSLDHAWNSQAQKTRAALSAVRLRAERGARAPRRSYYAPMSGHRLHSFEPGEIRWLRALAEQAVAAADMHIPEKEVPRNVAKVTALRPVTPTDHTATADISALGARIQAANEETGTLRLGSHPEGLKADRELTELVRAASRLPDVLRRRMGDVYGIGFTQALSRLRNAEDADAVASEFRTTNSRQDAPRWLEELATSLLVDAGAQTRDGTRTASIQLHSDQGRGTGYRAIEVESGATGELTALELVEQSRLSLAFAVDAWRGHSELRSAGKEGSWILEKGDIEESEFSNNERETLEAARRIENMLDRIERAHGKRTPTALERASMTVDALRTVGSATRTAAGWPSADEAPDPRVPEDIARIAAMAEALHEEIRSIANKFIASWIADTKGYGEADKDRAARQPQEESRQDASAADKHPHTGAGWKAGDAGARREWGKS